MDGQKHVQMDDGCKIRGCKIFSRVSVRRDEDGEREGNRFKMREIKRKARRP
jgi:hypothetical protein